MTLIIMAMPYPKPLFFLFLLHPLFISGSYAEAALSMDLKLEWQKQQIFPSSHRQVLDTISHDTVFPTTPISTTPITIPPESDTPFVTVPATNPVTITPSTPLPVTTYPPPAANVPVMNPPATTNASAAGQSWCVAKSGAPASSVQAALDYACGIGGADCAQIQPSGSCYNPLTLQNHASYAFNSYYQKHPSPSSCDFGGTAMITSTNPSTGSCIFPSSSSSSSSPSLKPPPTPSIPPPSTSSIPPPATSSIPPPATSSTPPPATSSSTPPPQISTPITTTPTPTSSSSGAGVTGSATPPMLLNSSNPTSGTPTVFGSEVPPSVNTTTMSVSATLQPSLGCIFLVASFATQKLIL